MPAYQSSRTHGSFNAAGISDAVFIATEKIRLQEGFSKLQLSDSAVNGQWCSCTATGTKTTEQMRKGELVEVDNISVIRWMVKPHSHLS